MDGTRYCAIGKSIEASKLVSTLHYDNTDVLWKNLVNHINKVSRSQTSSFSNEDGLSLDQAIIISFLEVLKGTGNKGDNSILRVPSKMCCNIFKLSDR